jgi:hypothetical protein
MKITSLNKEKFNKIDLWSMYFFNYLNTCDFICDCEISKQKIDWQNLNPNITEFKNIWKEREYLAVPLMYNFRHTIELFLKILIIEFKFHKPEFNLDKDLKNHDILDLFKKIELEIPNIELFLSKKLKEQKGIDYSEYNKWNKTCLSPDESNLISCLDDFGGGDIEKHIENLKKIVSKYFEWNVLKIRKLDKMNVICRYPSEEVDINKIKLVNLNEIKNDINILRECYSRVGFSFFIYFEHNNIVKK